MSTKIVRMFLLFRFLQKTVLEEYLYKLFRPVNCQVKQTFKKTVTESNFGTKISL